MVPFKGSVQFLFLCKPQKSGALSVYPMFPHITQKILTADTFHWLVLIPDSHLSIDIQFAKKQPLRFLNISENMQENNKKTISSIYSEASKVD